MKRGERRESRPNGRRISAGLSAGIEAYGELTAALGLSAGGAGMAIARRDEIHAAADRTGRQIVFFGGYLLVSFDDVIEVQQSRVNLRRLVAAIAQERMLIRVERERPVRMPFRFHDHVFLQKKRPASMTPA